jgi:hypothetical protein
MKYSKHWLVTSLVGLALMASTWQVQPAQAQSRALGLASVAIELWPEYDRPTVLVQISGTLDPGVALPAAVVVRLPAASGGPLAVATRTAAGALVNAPYTTTVSGDQILVTLQADTADFHVEYYDPALAITGAARAYTFRWTTDYAVAAAAVRVQAPVDSSQLTADPALTAAGPGDDGLNYYTNSLGALAAGQAVSLRLAYSKSSSTLSSEKLTASPAKTPAAPPALTFASPWLWGGVAAGLLVFAVAVWAFWWLRVSQRETSPKAIRRRRPARLDRARRAGAPRDPAPAATGFCTQCGRRLVADDRFCRSCGAPVRK